MHVRTRVNFSPHSLVWVVSAFATFYAAAQALEMARIAPYERTYRQATFIVGSLVADSDGRIQWAEGFIEPGGMKHTHAVVPAPNGGFVMYGDPAVPAQPGKRMRIWWSDVELVDTPAVASMPCLPTREIFYFWIIFAVGLFFAGLRFTVWAGSRR